MANKIRRHVYLSGRVQGVGFRAYTARQAKNLNVTGWVKNLLNGDVEAVFCGNKKQVNKMLDLVKEGPPFAEVEKQRVECENYQGKFNDFKIKY